MKSVVRGLYKICIWEEGLRVVWGQANQAPFPAEPVSPGEAVKSNYHLLGVGSEIMALLSTFSTTQIIFYHVAAR